MKWRRVNPNPFWCRLMTRLREPFAFADASPMAPSGRAETTLLLTAGPRELSRLEVADPRGVREDGVAVWERDPGPASRWRRAASWKAK